MSSNPRNRRALTLKEGQFYGPHGQSFSTQPQQLLASSNTLSVQPTALLAPSGPPGHEEHGISHRLLRQSLPNTCGGGATTFNYAGARVVPVESSVIEVSAPPVVDRSRSLIAQNSKKPATPTNAGDQYSSRSSSGKATPGSFSTGDRVIFEESAAHPNVPLAYRTPEERAANPDRLSLDRRGLAVCPILEGEENLRLLNYQHNLITKIQHLSSLRKLIFLDLYDNQIQSISGLSALKSLRVLMLGKNQIRKIEGLDNIVKLDVLDLHGNEIEEIENLQHLSELRVLNLAGNRIEHVKNVSGMQSLTELNLRRNRIRTVEEVNVLANLQRLFLSFNEITCWTNVNSLAYSTSLSELTMDGNPFAKESHYKQTVIINMIQLRQLDMKRISEEERRIATAIARKEEEKRREKTKINAMKEKRRAAINNARRQWEVGISSSSSAPLSTSGRANGLSRMPEVLASHITTLNLPRPRSASGAQQSNSVQNGEQEDADSSARSTGRFSQRPDSARSSLVSSMSSHARSVSSTGLMSSIVTQVNQEPPVPPSVTDSGVSTSQTTSVVSAIEDESPETDLILPSEAKTTHLAEVSGDTMYLYGSGALEALDRQWGLQTAGSVHTIAFKFIEFDDLARHLHRLRARFPSVIALSFENVNLRTLSQFNALATLRRLESLTVVATGNPVTEFKLWRYYILFRLSYFKIKSINGEEVTPVQIITAEKLFSGLCRAAMVQHTQAHLRVLLEEAKRKATVGSDSGVKLPVTGSACDVVGRSGLLHQTEESLQQRRSDLRLKENYADAYVTELVNTTAVIDQRKAALAKAWPDILSDFLQSVIGQVANREEYTKTCWQEFITSYNNSSSLKKS